MRVKSAAVLTAAALLMSFLQGCGGEKTVVTLLYGKRIPKFEAYVESCFEDIDIVWERHASSSLDATIERRMEAGYGPDIVIAEQPPDAKRAQNLIALDGYGFSAMYNSSALGSLILEERLYYLPLPSEYLCYVVNKTLFDEAGIKLPATNGEFIDALKYFKSERLGTNDTGHVFAFYLMNDVSIGTYLMGCMVPDFLGQMEGVKWFADYERKKAAMSGTWDSLFDILDTMKEEDLVNLLYFSRQGNEPKSLEEMGRGRLAAVFGSSAFMDMCIEENAAAAAAGQSREYEYVMLPFFGRENTHGWAVQAASDYIGINAAVRGDEKKLDACLRTLEALSTADGQRAIMEDLHLNDSSLKAFSHSERAVPHMLEDVVKDGYVYYSRFPGRSVDFLGAQAKQYLNGTRSARECLEAVDEYNISGTHEDEEDIKILGCAEETMLYQYYNVRLGETPLGNFVADAVAAYANAPIAVVNGGGIRASIYAGSITKGDLNFVCPYENQITVVNMTGETLCEMLASSVAEYDASATVPAGRFLSVSGIRYEFDSSREADKRLIGVYLQDGGSVDKEAVYTVAINSYMAGRSGYLGGNGDGYTMLNLYSDDAPRAQGVEALREDIGTYRDALEAYIKASERCVSSKTEGRIIDAAAKR